MMRILAAALAIASGLIILAGYFLPELTMLDQLRFILTDWAIIIAGMAVLVGILNLVSVQMEKTRTKQKGGMYGALLVISLIVTFGLGLVFGPDHSMMRVAVEAVIVPVEASLLAILAVTLVYASIRLLRRRADVMGVIFLVTVVLFLIAVMPTPFGPIPVLDQLILGIAGMISNGGARGLLIGVALGTLLTGLRVLFGIDRPYGGK
ncbi:YfhO family protein [Chloroflexi bacterium CFX6]|nr:YfhO family protein [Chloroflexi bacterium CFX6]